MIPLKPNPSARTHLLYAESSRGKTFQLEKVLSTLKSLYEWAPGDPPLARIITADSTFEALQPHIDDGSAQVLHLLAVQHVIPVAFAVAQGWWYKEPGNPILVKPEKDKRLPPVVLFEGLSELSDAMLNEHVADNRKIAEDVVGSYILQSSAAPGFQYTSGQPGRAHYGHVQKDMLQFLRDHLLRLPVEWIFCTAHEGKGKEDGVLTLAPKLSGKAGGPAVPQKFAHVFHLQVETPKGSQAVYKAWFRPHPDNPASQVSMNWPAKVSLDAKRTGELLKLYPQGFIPCGLEDEGLGKFVRFLWGPKG